MLIEENGERFVLTIFLIFLSLGLLIYVWRHDCQKRQESADALEQIRALAKVYESMFIVDLDKDTVEPVKANDFLRGVMSSIEGGFSQKVKEFNRRLLPPEFIPAMDAFTDVHTLKERLDGRETITQEFNGLRTGWNRARFVVVGDAKDPHQVIYAVENINTDKLHALHLQELAELDRMTGVLNRGNGEMQIRRLLSEGRGGMLAIMDLDKFKQINDTYGHLAGDEVLREVAACLKGAFRESDIVLRYGGDEFMVFAPCLHDAGRADAAVQRFFAGMKEMKLKNLPSSKVKVSVGICLIPENDEKSFEAYIAAADRGVYLGKLQQGNSVYCSDTE